MIRQTRLPINGLSMESQGEYTASCDVSSDNYGILKSPTRSHYALTYAAGN